MKTIPLEKVPLLGFYEPIPVGASDVDADERDEYRKAIERGENEGMMVGQE